MPKIFKILQGILFDTMGGVATSALLICTLSGILLAVPYDARNPLDTVSLILLNNPAAAFIRNIHYWSAQLLLVFTLLHIIDHFIQQNENRLSTGIWIRLIFSVPVLLFAMISGFILKGDADSLSAFRILTSLIEKIPWIGSVMNDTFLGSESNLGLIYVHHIATSTIILVIVLYEHARKIWPAAKGLLIGIFISTLLAYFFHAHAGTETGKGPWYFVGFQEILRWFSRPGLIWLILAILLGILVMIPRIDTLWRNGAKYFLLIFLGFYLILTLIATFFQGNALIVHFHPLTLITADRLGYSQPIPVIKNQREGCLVCHSNVVGFSPSHNTEALGCYSCHKGNPFTLDKDLAHRNMVLIPGNLEDAVRSCGSVECHPDIPHRVNNSLMSTMSGVVTVDRFVFGETDSLNALAHVKDLGHSPADQHLRDLCANCHLGNKKTKAGAINDIDRGGGCLACHLNYSDSALVSLTQAKTRLTSGTFYHPQLNINITDNHCFSCHSRSGRITLNYKGWQETLYEKDNIPDSGEYVVLEDHRVVSVYKEDVHHQAGMVCIDCHLAVELMGDGMLYAHKEDQVKIGCGDCHFRDNPKTLNFEELDLESKNIITLRKWKTDETRFIISAKSDQAIINTWIDSNNFAWLRLKTNDSAIIMKPPALPCSKGNSHLSLSCESCHTGWVPSCIGCHNAYDKQASGYDMLEDYIKTGSWVEHVALFLAERPALGIVKDEDGKELVRTFTSGMILSIDKGTFPDEDTVKKQIFRRLYAPISAHTTQREGRSCSSCHRDPLAIGYGRGELVYKIEGNSGRWTFTNRFELNKIDNLPQDAWIGFLEDPSGVYSTRANARPFNHKEQQKILTVGACLVCHEENSKVMNESLIDFQALLMKTTDKCILPAWK